MVLGNFPFTAQGENTETRWTVLEGIPAVEAVWWAGGIRVTECLFALQDRDAFLRRITLESKDLLGPEQVTLRLSLPPGDARLQDGLLVQKQGPMTLALGVVGEYARQASVSGNSLSIGPTELAVGHSITVDSLLLAQLPPNGKPRWQPAFDRSTLKGSSPPALDLGNAIAETRLRWAAASKITSGDPLLRETYDSASNTLPAVIADNGIVIAGPFQYGEGQWVRDSSNTLIGAIHAGHFELARAGLERILTHLIDDRGSTLVAGEIQSPDREQFDQMGEFLQALKAYRDFTGDDSLIRRYRAKIIAMVERPLKPEFRDAATGMVHNRREYWERTFDDAYELIYQAYVALGLRTAADLAEPLDARDRAQTWREAAEKMWKSATSDPKFALVEKGKFIKRRNVDGKIFDIFRNPHPYQRGGPEDAIETETIHALNPDSTAALPIALGLVDPHSPLARATLDDLEKIRAERWFGGGYMRYSSTCELNQIGPWPFATCFVLRAARRGPLRPQPPLASVAPRRRAERSVDRGDLREALRRELVRHRRLDQRRDSAFRRAARTRPSLRRRRPGTEALALSGHRPPRGRFAIPQGPIEVGNPRPRPLCLRRGGRQADRGRQGWRDPPARRFSRRHGRFPRRRFTGKHSVIA